MVKLNETVLNDEGYQLVSGFDANQNQQVLVKVPRNTSQKEKDLASAYKRELNLQQKAASDGVLEALGVAEIEGRPALVMREFGGKSLAARAADGQPMPLAEFFAIALPLVRTLGELHAKHIIHKDIRPGNILYNGADKGVKLIGFGLSTQLSREVPSLSAPAQISGSLPYLSPEQTGRMNRQMDYRTDFYSLGVTFFQLLTGQLPFQHTDPLELIHSHLARPVPRLTEVAPGLPAALGLVIEKLMAKAAEDRYQSAEGLAADLEAIRDGRTEGFVPGRNDVSHSFQIPQKLYGRDADLKLLLDTFDNLQTGRAEVMLISGYSGIGKSSLVREVYKPITQRKGYFISGKFDQLARNVPYASIIQAFEELIRQLLTQPEREIERWKSAILDVLGNSARVITDVIPQLELLIGRQPEVPALGPQESRNRFNLLFLNFIKVFGADSHPLVLFLDDLQWADAGSLDLVQQLVTDPGTQHLMLIGAYRDNEVGPAHPFTLAMENIERAGVVLKSIHLKPLSLTDVQDLVADTFRRRDSADRAFAELILAKTAGNPFFITEFLRSLNEQGLIEFSRAAGRWTYHLDRVGQAAVSDDVVELMVSKIRKLPAEAQAALRMGACFGNEFGLGALSALLGQNEEATGEWLWPALAEGLLLAKGDTFRFAHDRIQQAAYQTVTEAERTANHIAIGRWLMAQPDGQTVRVFDTANQLNLGAANLKDAAERLQAAHTNLAAGRKAKASAAFEPALAYFEHGKGLLPADAWATQHNLALDLEVEHAESLHLVGRNTDAQQGFDRALGAAKTNAQRSDIYEKKIHFYTNIGQFGDAYATARAAVGLYGIKLPASITKPQLILKFIGTKMKLGKKTPDQLLNLPEAKDEEIRTAIRIISVVLKAAYQIAPPLAVANGIKIVQLTLKHGNVADNAVGWLVFGPIFVGGIVGDRQTGFDIGHLALNLIEKYNNAKLRAEVNFVFGYFGNSWTKPITEAEQYYQRAYNAGLESGDLFHVGCAAAATCMSQAMRGVSVPELLLTTHRYADFLRPLANKDFANVVAGVQQASLNLAGQTNSATDWSTPDFNEADYVAQLPKFVSPHFAHFYYIAKARNLYLFGQPAQAAQLLKGAESYLESSTGMFHSAEHGFWAGMAAGAMAAKGDASQKGLLKKALKSIGKAAARCPANFAARLALLNTANALASRNAAQAATHAKAAIAAAEAEDNLLLQALAYQLLAQATNSPEATQTAQLLWNAQGATAVAGFLVSGEYVKAEAAPSVVAKGAIVREAVGTSSPPARNETVAVPPHLPVVANDAVNETETPATSQPDTQAEVPVPVHTPTPAAEAPPQPPVVEKTESAPTAPVPSGSSDDNLDLATVLKAAQALAGEIKLESLMANLMHVVMENAGADKAALLHQMDGSLKVLAITSPREGRNSLLPMHKQEQESELPQSVLNYAWRTGQYVLLDNAAAQGQYTNDEYIARQGAKSVLALQIQHKGERTGLLYLENGLTTAAFTPARLQLMQLLSGQIAVSVENALLYENLEMKVQERTRELSDTLEELRATQQQMIQSEKMAALGQLIAGIAHEINTPIGAIRASNINIANALDATLKTLPGLLKQISDEDLALLLALVARAGQSEEYLSSREERKVRKEVTALFEDNGVPNPDTAAETLVYMGVFRDVEPFIPLLKHPLTEQIQQVASNLGVQRSNSRNIGMAVDRASKIVFALKSYSRQDNSGQAVKASVSEGIDTVLTIYGSQLKQGIEVIKQYAPGVPDIDCLPDELNQVWTNIIHNGLQAMNHRGTLEIAVRYENNVITVDLSDSGSGIPADVLPRIFEPFYTTKAAGEGSGLGLDICRKIVTKHGGDIVVHETGPGRTTFRVTLPVPTAFAQ